ncbi:conserved hypothetical protein [Chlorobaculum parvum NCIB 8327]|uniref:Uncharacterized protein n=2 Tax=Chlorobiaceae TaxID=191412 RepID=B3QR41_CHLP8|nr:hypothetical protein [Chlorobaculum parvum]ACF10699.1 conserved hypothetical protein [Chlorobaculum parvum NCIB 8327]
MANFSLYISGQTELGDVAEFFQKRLIGEGETPIAFFDGVFYESHQERVGNIVYQDYLIFSDKALYLWARGASKDYLDRFTLGAVSVNSRNKDSAFATMNLKIRREGKEPVFVIFDMVEIREAEMVIKLQTAVESTIEDYLGVNYRQEIPPDAAGRILQAARAVCPPRNISLPLESPEAPQMPVPDAGIGYGQDLLEQYRAMGGQPGAQQAPSQGSPYGERPQAGGMGMPGIGAPPFAPRGGLESMLPTDPASLKRIADQIKNMVGDAPFKLRDQVMKDLQHVPGDVATVLTALNELLANIAGNPMAERFVMNAIKTAVVNDGMIGSLGKIIKMTGFGSGGGKKSSQPASDGPAAGDDRSASRPRKSPFEEEPDDNSSTIRRKKISVKDDEESSVADLFAGSDEPITSREERKPAIDDTRADGGGRRKKLSIKMEDDNEIARKLMSYDESEREAPVSEPEPVKPESPVASQPVDSGSGVRRKKVAIKAEEGSGARADVAQKLMSYDETTRGAINTLSKSDEPKAETAPELEPEKPVRKKIQIVAAEESESDVVSASEPEPEEDIPVIEMAAIEAALELEAESGIEPELAEASVPEPEPEIPVRKKLQVVASDEPNVEAEPEPEAPETKKVQVVASEESATELKPEVASESEPEEEAASEASASDVVANEAEPAIASVSETSSESEEITISEEALFVALGEEPKAEKRSSGTNEYMTIESDEPEKKIASVKPTEQQRRPSGKAGRSKRRGRKV